MIKKFLLVAAIGFYTSNICYAEMIMPTQSIENEVIQVEKPNQAYTMLNKIRKDRNTIYNVLNLTPSQIYKTREIEKERFEEVTPLVDELMSNKKKLRELKSQEDSNREIKCIERNIDKISAQIKHISDKHDKRFEKLLSKEQKNKYDMVQKLRMEDLKKYNKIEKYGKKKTDLKPFGYDISQPQYMEDLKQERTIKNQCKNFFLRK